MTQKIGAAGRMAAAFINSRLTPLFIIASVALGAMAVTALPREEEPQIIVPMVDVFAAMPGASAAEVEQRLTRPMEKLLWEIPGVEYLYSTSSPGQAMIIVRFLVGENETDALVRLNHKLDAHAAEMPPGARPPVVRARSIDDVPVMAVTLSGDRYDDHDLRLVAGQLSDALKEVPNVSEVTLIGGRGRRAQVDLDPARLAAYGIDPVQVRDAIASANVQVDLTGPVTDGVTSALRVGRTVQSIEDLRATVIGSRGGRPLLLGDVADVRDEDARPTSVVVTHDHARAYPAVTLAVAKRQGVNAITLAHAIEAKLESVKGTVVPSDMTVAITRNYGETAGEKSNELLLHMLIAIVSVSILIWMALGRREAVVVLIAIPVTLALTLFTFYLYGYTLNRITLFALIFSIGILVDDAIVVVENVVRHARMRTGESNALAAIAVQAVDEVGNPTILATLAVIAAILPMAFVGGLMGPYMRPIPVGASAAMVFSLIVAFIVTPWAAVRLLKPEGAAHDEREGRFTLIYRRVMRQLLENGRTRVLFLTGVLVLLVGAMAFVPLRLVEVKMLPFDNKSEFQVMVDMPEGTPLETTARVADALAREALADPVVKDVQTYTGTSAPYNFNGLVRHYFLRNGAHLADLQVNLVHKGDRSEQSHDIAKRVRERLLPVAAKMGASIQVAEVPPGPPVLQTLVAEVYGPDATRRLEIAQQVKTAMAETAGIVDVDWYVEDPQPRITLDVDVEKAAAAGVPVAAVASVVRMAVDGEVVGLLHDAAAREAVPVVLQLPRPALGGMSDVGNLRVGPSGVALRELTRERRDVVDRSVYHKNLQPVTYVTADVAGVVESPVYAITAVNEKLAQLTLPEGYAFDIFNAVQPADTSKYAMKWDGEWHITIEVFRDLGIAFAIVLMLIYILVVGWFQSFATPMAIMVAIPFSLVGILPAHAAMGAFFTATSMIGFIAGAGIVVRNSIILVDFIELRLQEGQRLEDAVVDAGAVRFRPMVLTAAAVIVGAGVILFDPIFQGLAISLMAGEVASLLLSRMTVPVLYYVMRRRVVEAGAMTSPELSAEI
ncbi:MAG: efflux RND transporter permease subunit [Acidobacteria bacterium]|nr:efflux RND transporter permease subunit [Acidobacteriota bacterium]